MDPIVLKFDTIDRFHERKTFKTLAGAKQYAQKRMGTCFDIGPGYAVDMYGTGKLTLVKGNVTLEQLLTREEPTPRDPNEARAPWED